MRHSKKRHKLGRTAPHRKATLAALSNALIAHKRITTTVPKAKALRTFIEPLITRAKDDSQHNRRQVFRRLQDKQAVTTLFSDVSEQVGDRPGGYTRVVKLGRRNGDGAPMAMIELVDYNDVQPDSSGGSSGRTRRGSGKGRRRSKKKSTETSPTTSQTTSQPTETKTETADQVDTAEKGVETEAVEHEDAAEQPVTDRSESEPAEEEVDAAEDAVEARKEGMETTESEEAEATETGEAEAETADAPESEATESEEDDAAPTPSAEKEAADEPDEDDEKAAT